jgi:ribosomal protein S18 acetylase RimI-like enzyme
MVATAPLEAAVDPGATSLGDDDVPDMLELIAATRPGPFEPRTIEFGGYIGVRREGRLIAMAGERVRLEGYTEISGVCTDASCRGEGLASALVTILVQRFRDRGDEAFLHTAADNATAIRVYEKLGFELRRFLDVLILGRKEGQP